MKATPTDSSVSSNALTVRTNNLKEMYDSGKMSLGLGVGFMFTCSALRVYFYPL